MVIDGSTRQELEALLRWYVDMGVDVAVDAEPHDRFVEAASAAQTETEVDRVHDPVQVDRGAASIAMRPAEPGLPHAGFPAPNLAAAALSADGAVRSAREIAAAATTLQELEDALRAFDGCALKRTATRLAFADGDPRGRVMAVGEAPGAEEDRQGRPFSGRSGQLLDRMLQAIGLDRSQVYIANVVPWRPPGNRTPTPQEVAICRPFIARQIQLADPEILVCLGGPAAQSLLGSKEGIMRLRGRWHDFDTGQRIVRALPMLHPAYLLRQPAHKKFAWADLRALRKALDASP